MFRFLFFSIFLIFSLVSVKLMALEVSDLYQVTVVVDSQTRVQREQAIKKALQGVFLKIGGKKSVLKHKLLLQALKKSSVYVNQYRYQRKIDELSLVVTFNENKVNQLFKDADLALWGSLRPQVLLWLIDEQGASRRIIAYDANTLITESINDFSMQRGLPIVMPLMDLTDSEQVVLSDFWGYFPEQIQQASSRYFADTVIVMRISDSSLVIERSEELIDTAKDVTCGLLCEQKITNTPRALDWKVYTQGALYTQHYEGVDKVSLITQGLSDITELIYQSYALLTTAQHDFVIEVKNVTSLKNDTQLFDFLTDLSAVKAVTLISAQGNVRRYKLDLMGTKSSFLASLKLNNQLTQEFDSKLDKPFDTSRFNTSRFNSDANTSDNINSVNNQIMKVIVLGNDTTTVSNADDSMKNSKRLNTDIDVPAVNNSVIVAGEKIVPLTFIPNIPMFYWEQG